MAKRMGKLYEGSHNSLTLSHTFGKNCFEYKRKPKFHGYGNRKRKNQGLSPPN